MPPVATESGVQAPADAMAALETSDESGPSSPIEGSWDPTSEKLAALSLFALLIVVLAWALPRSVQGGDAAEFSVVMLRGGIAHPSGYPWMRLLSPVASMGQSLGLSPASAAALGPALFGLAAWMLWQRTLTRWVHPAIALFWCALVGSCSLSVEHLYDAEVWGPHMFFVALFVNLSTRDKAWPPWVIGLAIGAATAHHLTAALLAPLAVAAAWPERSEGFARKLVTNGAQGLAGSLLGLSVLLTLRLGVPDAADPGWTWGQFDTWAGWLHHISRGDYGTTELSLHESSATVFQQIMRAWQSVANNLSVGREELIPAVGPIALVILIGGAGLGMRRALPRPLLWGYAGCLTAALVFFPSLADLDPDRPHSVWILERFDFLPLALVMGAAACACEALRAHHENKPLIKPIVARALGYLCAALFLVNSCRGSLAEPPSDDSGVEAYARAIYATPDPKLGRAIIFGTDDHRSFPAVYFAEVIDPQSDVLYIDPSLMSYAWYQERIYARWPELPREVVKPVKLIMAIEADPALRDTPIYLANYFSGPSHSLPLVPEGVLMRLRPHTKEDPSSQVDEIIDAHYAALERIAQSGVSAQDFGGPLTRRGVWTGDLLWSFVDRHTQMIRLCEGAGRPELIGELRTRLKRLDTPGLELLN